MYQHKNIAGYSIVEVLIAISILMISIIGPLTIASKGLQNAQFAREQNIGFFLAQEGLESVIQIRNTGALDYFAGSSATAWDWTTDTNIIPANCFSGSACGVVIGSTNTVYECSGTNCVMDFVTSPDGYEQNTPGGTASGYTRQLLMERSGTENVRVRSVVTWQNHEKPETVVLEGYIYNIYGN